MAKTAAQLTDEEIAHYRAAARRREAQARQVQVQRREQARAAARQAAVLLKERFGATRVLLFGSVVHAGFFHRRSDVDLAVEGIESRNFWRAWAALDRLGSEFEIDLVDVETAPPALREAILREGVEL